MNGVRLRRKDKIGLQNGRDNSSNDLTENEVRLTNLVTDFENSINSSVNSIHNFPKVPGDIGLLFDKKVKGNSKLLSKINGTSVEEVIHFVSLSKPLPVNLTDDRSLYSFAKSQEGKGFISRLFVNLGYNDPWGDITYNLSWRGTTLQSMLFDYRPDGFDDDSIIHNLSADIILRAKIGSNYEFWKAIFKLALWSYQADKGNVKESGVNIDDSHDNKENDGSELDYEEIGNRSISNNDEKQLNTRRLVISDSDTDESEVRSSEKPLVEKYSEADFPNYSINHNSEDNLQVSLISSFLEPSQPQSPITFKLHDELSLNGVVTEIPDMFDQIFSKIDVGDKLFDKVASSLMDNGLWKRRFSKPNLHKAGGPLYSFKKDISRKFTSNDESEIERTVQQLNVVVFDYLQSLGDENEFQQIRIWLSESLFLEQNDSQYTGEKRLLVPFIFHTKEPKKRHDSYLVKNSLVAIIKGLPVVEKLFNEQSDRVYIHFVTFCNQFMRCYVIDRSRAYETQTIHIVEHPELFIKAMIEYRLMTRGEMGFDSTMEYDEGDDENRYLNTFIHFADHGRLKVLEEIPIRKYGIFEKSTIARIVERESDKSRFFLKEAWYDDDDNSKYNQEYEVYKLAGQYSIPYMPKLVEFEEVRRTSHLMKRLHADQYPILHKYFVDLDNDRVQCRLLLENIGFGEIFRLKSLSLMFRCLSDITTALKLLYINTTICHGDICSENLLVFQGRERLEGLLVDFDLSSTKKDEERRVEKIKEKLKLEEEMGAEESADEEYSDIDSSNDEESANNSDDELSEIKQYLPSMTIDRLESVNDDDLYRFFHDLESVFWILLLEATSGVDDFFQNWHELDLDTLIARKKIIVSEDYFENFLTETMVNDKYIQAIGYIHRLKRVIFDHESRLKLDTAMYDRVIEIFDEASEDEYYERR